MEKNDGLSSVGFKAYYNLGAANPPYPTVFIWGGDLAYNYVGYKSRPTYTWMRAEYNTYYDGTGETVVFEANFTQEGKIYVVATGSNDFLNRGIVHGVTTGSVWALDSIPSSGLSSAFILESIDAVTATWSYNLVQDSPSALSAATSAPTPAPTTAITIDSVSFFGGTRSSNLYI